MPLWIYGWGMNKFNDPFAGGNWATNSAYLCGIVLFTICLISFRSKKYIPVRISPFMALWPIGVFFSFVLWLFIPYLLFLVIYSLAYFFMLIPWWNQFQKLNSNEVAA